MSDTIDRNISEQTTRAGGSPAEIQRNFLSLHSSIISQSRSSSKSDSEWFAKHYENARLTSSAVSSGVLVGSIAYEMYQDGDSEFGGVFKDIALETFKLAGEIAVEFPPAIGTAIGLFEASTGVDLPYGDELTVLERGLSFVGAIAGTVPGGKSVVTVASKFFKGLGDASTRLAKHAPAQYGKLSEFAHNAFRIVESSKTAGAKTSQGIKEFVDTLNKFKLEPPIWPKGIDFNANLKKHMSTFDGFAQNTGVKGAHNAEAFERAVTEKGVRVTNTTNHPTANGFKQTEYAIPKLDRTGTPTGEFKGGFKKTVYDPNVVSDAEVTHLGQIAAGKGYESAISQGLREYSSEAGGVTFRVFLENGVITNVFPRL